MRVAFAFAVITAVLIAGSVSAADGTVVLGAKDLFAPGGVGWGTAHPRYVFNGGDPNGTAWKLRWKGWGSTTATARGLTWIFKPTGGYFTKPGAIEFRASRIARCAPAGPRAYTTLLARESLAPGGRFGSWFRWNGLASLCHRP